MPPKYINKLHNKRVLILGGTSGIGFCVAENVLENGAIVIVASSRQESIDKTLARLRESYPDSSKNVSGHVIDLRSDNVEAHIICLLDSATNNAKAPLDHIVSTAGDNVAIQPLSAFNGMETIISAQRVRYNASMLIAKHAPGKYLRRSNHSSITLTGGVNTHRPGNNWAIPASLGAALHGLVRALAVDLRPIRVNIVEPGATDTELFSRTFTDKERLEKLKEVFRKQTLTGEMGRPEDVSEAYIYFMRDRFVTGQSVLTEGGLLLAAGAER
ncbi:hypothetical protein PMZ80_006217 [Knufia obscura]|uniref:Short chain dehydrogenase n=2 Tax=Knufia TaxID=430999 RepID=A0AAN8EEA9_9EURO|nr:hypothetical protein PMZ80_006217 [Knufia obscura]KAK5953634.1 hypothetical protein OHC33_005578 [Knufia fluminis]